MLRLQHLLHDALIRTKHVENAAIIKIRENSVITSRGFQILPEEAQALVDAFQNTTAIRKEGFFFQDKNYICVRADNSSIYAKHLNQGLVLIKTAECVLIATYGEGMYPSVCVETVEKLGDFFKEKETKYHAR